MDLLPLYVRLAVIPCTAMSIFLLADCAPVTRHQIELRSTRVPAEQVEAAVEALDLGAAANGVTEAGVAQQIIAQSWLILDWHDGDVACPGSGYPPGWRFAGCRNGHMLDVSTRPCVADSALVHELAHVILERTRSPDVLLHNGRPAMQGDPDRWHSDPRVWEHPSGAVALANQQIRARFCP